MYLVQSWIDYFERTNQNLYKSKKVKMPVPELYVIYTGERKTKPSQILLSKEFFGGKTSIKAAKYRVPVAAKAFFSGRSEKIMLCGGKIRNFSSESMAEADNMYKRALELGVPETSLIIEKSSQNTIENILCSLL